MRPRLEAPRSGLALVGAPGAGRVAIDAPVRPLGHLPVALEPPDHDAGEAHEGEYERDDEHAPMVHTRARGLFGLAHDEEEPASTCSGTSISFLRILPVGPLGSSS